MSGELVLIDREPRRRPRRSWAAARAAAKSEALSTESTLSYLRDGLTLGGWRAVMLPATVGVLITIALLVGALGAAVVAASTNGPTGRALLLIGASVALSQAITAVQNRRPVRWLSMVAALRVRDIPPGWGIAFVRVPSRTANSAKAALLHGSFAYVEVSYFRDDEYAMLAAYRQLGEEQPTTSEHFLVLLAHDLGAAPHLLTGATIAPPI